MHLIRCSLFDVPDVHAELVFAATRRCVCSFISNTNKDALSEVTVKVMIPKMFNFVLFGTKHSALWRLTTLLSFSTSFLCLFNQQLVDVNENS